MPTIKTTPNTFALRRCAARQGFRLWRVRKGSRWYRRCGPFALIDDETNSVVLRGMTLGEVAERLNAFT